MPTAYVLYNAAVAGEDKAPPTSEKSALARPYGRGRHTCFGTVLYNMPLAPMR